LKKEIIIFSALLLVAILIILTGEPPEPENITSEKTTSNYSNLLFDYIIIRYPTNVEIFSYNENSSIGIATDPWNLNFGVIPGNGSFVRRYIGISNSKEKYNKIYIKSYGNITPFLNFSKNYFRIKENESTAIEVGLYTDSADFGNYSGEIDVIIKLPRYDLYSIFV